MECVLVTTQQEFLRRLSQDKPFDCAIVDFQLPGIDGLALAETVRQFPGCQHLRILLLTSAHLRARDPRALAAGISVSVYKPVRPKQMLESLGQAFDPQSLSVRNTAASSVFDPLMASRLPLRILLADDSRVNQKVGQALLDKLGYRADVVSNGLEVLHALDLQPYDIVFLDLQMPKMDGCSASREIHRCWGDKNRPRIIALTGAAMLGDRERCTNREWTTTSPSQYELSICEQQSNGGDVEHLTLRPTGSTSLNWRYREEGPTRWLSRTVPLPDHRAHMAFK